jgi:hypothetical protein
MVAGRLVAGDTSTLVGVIGLNDVGRAEGSDWLSRGPGSDAGVQEVRSRAAGQRGKDVVLILILAGAPRSFGWEDSKPEKPLQQFTLPSPFPKSPARRGSDLSCRA